MCDFGFTCSYYNEIGLSNVMIREKNIREIVEILVVDDMYFALSVTM